MVRKLNLNELAEEPLKEDKKNPWWKLFSKNKPKKPNQVLTLYLRENGNCQPLTLTPKNGFFVIDGKTHHERRDCKFNIEIGGQRYPLTIIPEWKLVPVGTKEYDDLPIERKVLAFQDHSIAAIRHAELVKMGEQEGKKMNAKLVVILVIIGIIGLALMKNYL